MPEINAARKPGPDHDASPWWLGGFVWGRCRPHRISHEDTEIVVLTGASLAFLSSGGHDGRPCPRDVPAVNAGDAAGVAEIVRIFGATPRVSNSN